MSLPPNQTPQNLVPNRTPFDDDLIQDPNAPRHTQPLPSQLLPAQPPTSSTGSILPSGPSTVSGTPVLPRQVILNNDTTAPKTGVLPNKIPLSAIVGLAAVGGALAVVLISMAFRRVLPPSKDTSQNAISLATPTPDASRVVMVPRASTLDAPNDLPTPESPSTNVSPVQTPRDLSSPSVATSNTSETPEISPTVSPTPETSSTPDSESPSSTKNSTVNGVYRSRRHSYSIQAPSGFRLMQKGRRTNWHGPDDTKLLVEVGGAGDASPRESWEKLERTLQRKYGEKYQSKGIRETAINGKQAAVWEFELETRSGKVRKMDVAIHDGTKGFAVLATAPVDKFETWRPQFDKAIQSLQIESDATPTPTPDGY